mgnify:FL=1
MKYTECSYHVKYGDIYMVNLSGKDCEQRGVRPCIIFQNNIGNKYSPNVVILPLTSSIKKLSMPTHILVKPTSTNGLTRTSLVLCETPRDVSKKSLVCKLGEASEETMNKVAQASLYASCAIAHLDINTLMQCWNNARKMEAV